MSYVGTIAFNTNSTARHGGDPGWIRHANSGVITRPDSSFEGLGYAEGVSAVTNIVTTLAQLGKTFADLRQQKMDTKASRNAANDAAEKAAAAERETAASQAQLFQAAQTQTGDKSDSSKTLLIGGGILAAVVLGGIFLMRRR